MDFEYDSDATYFCEEPLIEDPESLIIEAGNWRYLLNKEEKEEFVTEVRKNLEKTKEDIIVGNNYLNYLIEKQKTIFVKNDEFKEIIEKELKLLNYNKLKYNVYSKIIKNLTN